MVALPLLQAVHAQEAADDDAALDRIPGESAENPPRSDTSRNAASSGVYVEEAAQYLQNRSALPVPLPGGIRPRWINRLFIDGHPHWQPVQSVKVVVSGRVEYYRQDTADNVATGTHTLNYDLREAFLAWAPDAQRRWFIDFGRINVRNGVAYAFNPTDFFRKQSVVDEVSQDPNALRNNRLGTVMVRVQHFMDRGTVAVLYAPKLDSELPIDGMTSAWDPQLRRTNAHHRSEFSAAYDFGHDIDPQVVVFHEGNAWSYGLNLTRGFGNQTTAYVEWSVGRRSDLIAEALQYAVRTGTFADASSPIPNDGAKRPNNDLAAGLSYTTKANINLIFEYDFHQAGFTRADWSHWFAAPGVSTAEPALRYGKLWYLRGYAAIQQEPLARDGLFVRVAKDDWPIPHMSISGLSIVETARWSSLTQTDVSYRVSSRLQMEGIFQAAVGRAQSSFGSVPVGRNYILDFQLYL